MSFMNSMMFRIKDKLYYYLVDKNWGVGPEYHRYVDTHPEEHAKNRWKSWWLLLRLNWHYRVLRKTQPLFGISIDSKGGKSNPKRKLPYLDGAESEVSKRRDAIYLAKDLLQYDVVSFDIFDTLVLRPFADPKDLFMIVGKRLNKTEFYRIRTDAEKRAREKATIEKGNREVTIDDIYTIIEERTGIPKEKGIQIELEVEMQYCFANPYMKRVFKILRAQGKAIIIVSDMYIPHASMEKLLANVGYTGYDKLYVSCDYNCSKRTGGLYQYVKRDYSGKKIVHIGDNVASDIQAAQKENLDVKYYKNCHEIGNKYRADGMSDLIGSAYAGIVNTHLHNGIKTYSPYYEYGFIYGGLYILGFCNWIHKKAKKERIDKVLFLSRDGDIYQRVFNMLFNDVSNEYFLWSRIANTKYTLVKNREDFLRRCIFYRALGVFKVTIGNVLNSLSINFMKKYLSDYGLNENTLVIAENVNVMERMFIDHWSEVCDAYKNEKEFLYEYIKNKIKDCRKVAIVDVGWMGSGALGIKYLVEEEFCFNTSIKCWQAAVKPPAHTDVVANVLEEQIEAYIFSRMYNRNHFDVHCNTNRGQNNVFFELFTQASYPSYGGFNSNARFIFDIPEVENYSIIKEIHRGIFDFCENYRNVFIRDSYMMNISGYDSYCPYRFIIRDLKWIKEYLSDMTFARGISGNVETYRLEKIDEMLKQVGL